MSDSKAHAAIHDIILCHIDLWLRTFVLEMWRFMVPNRSSYLLANTIVLKDLITTLREALETISPGMHEL